ncbi:MAG: hypothetical protein A2539_02895 [Elusimicrobia bacterium RIFOXYD2_FULL_34_15]|nr:MAG: hypothetical protein A2539_02895 [Elusimicrobia bacterium RIFOXYD2_FULL_34_15]
MFSPTDWAPEPKASNATKASLGIPEALYQGDGYRNASPAPIEMARITLSIVGSTEAARFDWQKLRVTKSTSSTGAYSDITEIALYKDTNGNSVFDGEVSLGFAPLDTFITSGTFNANNNPPDCILDFSGSNMQTIYSVPTNYFICVRVPITAQKGKTIGLRVLDTEYLTRTLDSAKLAANNFPFFTFDSEIRTNPPVVSIQATDIAAWYEIGAYAQYPTVAQGKENVGFIKFGAWTNEFTATLRKVRVSATGLGAADRLAQNIPELKIYTDLYATHDGIFKPSEDRLLSTVQFSTETATWINVADDPVTNDNNPNTIDDVEDLISPTTRWYYIAYKVGDNAQIGDTIGAKIPIDGFQITGGDLGTHRDFQSSEPSITSTVDTVYIVPRTSEGIPPENVVQGNKNRAIGAFKLYTDDNAAIWKNLKLKRVGNGNDSDVSAVKIWYDVNNDGLFDSTTDQLVSNSRTFGQPPDTQNEVNLTIYGPFEGQEIQKANQLQKTYFVTFDFSYFAGVGPTTPGFILETTNYIGVLTPDRVTAFNSIPPFERKIAGSIMEYSDEITIDPLSQCPATLMQGTTNVSMMRFKMTTEHSWAPWTATKVKRLGTSRDSDIDAVKIAKDNGDGVFNADKDVIIGSGTFGNYGIPGETYIRFSSWPVNYTQVVSTYTQFFYIVYDISDLSIPDFYIGAGFECIDSTNSVLATQSFSITAPNTMGTDNLPARSSLALIVPTPRVVTVVPTDLSKTACALASSINTSDTNLPIEPANTGAATFDPHGYEGRRVLIDNEVIYYTGVSTGLPYNYLLDCSRGDPNLANTARAGHANNSTVWKTMIQSEQNIPMIMFKAYCDGYNVKWSQLVLRRETLIGGDVLDSDVIEIKVWRDADGLNRGMFSADDVMISTGAFYPYKFGTPGKGNLGAEGMAYIDLDDPEYKNTYVPGVPGSFALITTTPTYYFVTFSISESARENDSIGCSLFRMDVNDPNSVSQANFPIKSATPIIKPTRDAMEVRYEDRVRKTVLQSTTDYAVLALDLRTDKRESVWKGLKLKKTGTAIDSDVYSINIYKDTNFSNDLEREFDEKITLGTDKFVEGTSIINLSENKYQIIHSYEYEVLKQSVDPKWNQRYFITLDINPTATVDNYLGVIIENTTDFIVVDPDYVEFKGLPAEPQSGYSTITDFPDEVTCEIYDIAPPSVIQGDTNVPMLWIKMKTDVSEATWKAILIDRIPKMQEAQQGAGGGANRDIRYIKIYRDANLNGKLEIGDDPLISSGTDQFPADVVGNTKLISLLESQKIGALSWKSYLIAVDVSPTAMRENTLGLSLASEAYFVLDLSQNRADVVKTFPTFETVPSAIGPIKVTAAPKYLIPAGLTQGKQYAMMSLGMKAHVHSVGWMGIIVEQIGTYNPPLSNEGDGDGDIAELGLYKDNGNGIFDGNEVFISSVVYGTPDFYNGVARLSFSTQTINTNMTTYYLVAMIGKINTSNRSTEGDQVGLRISNYGNLTINPYTAIASSDTVYPYLTPLGIVRHYSKASDPIVYVDEWISSQNEVKAAWIQGESPEPLQYPVIYNEYGVSTKPCIKDDDKPDFSGDYQRVELSTYVVANMPMPFDHNRAYYVSVRSVTSGAQTVRALGIASNPGNAMFKVDLSPPTIPGKPEPSTYVTRVPALAYTVNWNFSADPESGVFGYEVQEREDSNPVWQWYDVNGDGITATPKETHTLATDIVAGGITKLTVLAKKPGHFYIYRLRSKNKAGAWSQWSEMSEAASTGLPPEVISNVSNYPNPFDTRKGGEEGKTHITFILNQDADVTITLYDLLGYKVMEMNFGKGTPGGKQGPNDVTWEGKNELGDFVGRGGYIAHIKAVGDRGTKTTVRKIGVIH